MRRFDFRLVVGLLLLMLAVSAWAVTVPVKPGPSSILSSMIKDGTIAAVDIAPGAVTSAKLGADVPMKAASITGCCIPTIGKLFTWGANKTVANGCNPQATAVTSYTSSISLPIAYDCTNIQVAFINWYKTVGGTAQIPGPNAITIKASIKYKGVYYPLYFYGSASTILAPGTSIKTDPLPITIRVADASIVQILTYVTGTGQIIETEADQLFGYFSTVPSAYLWEPNADRTAGGTLNTYAGQMPFYIPAQLSGTPLDRKPKVVLGIGGDSISNSYRQPFLRENLAADNGSFGHTNDLWPTTGKINIGVNGETMPDFIAAYPRAGLISGCTDFILQIGTNNLSTGSTVAIDDLKPLFMSCWQLIASKGVRVWACTLPPRPTLDTTTYPSATWATATSVQQIADSSCREAINDWIRTKPIDPLTGKSPVYGVIDISDICSTARGSGKWKVGFTSAPDGVHPSGFFNTDKATINAGLNAIYTAIGAVIAGLTP